MTAKRKKKAKPAGPKRRGRKQIPNRDLIRFGQEIRKRRKALDISQEELGFRAGLHRNYIGYVERAEENATVKQVIKIARALKLRPSELVRGMTWSAK
ncbi:MAG TPA: helix-turn-helix transcriptional regulator [Rhizomicrobium sp.]|nr:helix-turn-helix transcriptional regulator [Rhizomicrobium sp.]